MNKLKTDLFLLFIYVHFQVYVGIFDMFWFESTGRNATGLLLYVMEDIVGYDAS